MNYIRRFSLLALLVCSIGFGMDELVAGPAFKPILSCNALADINLDVKVARSRLRHDTLRTWYTITVIEDGKVFPSEMYGRIRPDLSGSVATENGKEWLTVKRNRGAFVGSLTFGNHKDLRLTCSPLR